MDGLHDITGGEAIVRLGGRELRLPPFRLRHWGALERHYLNELPDPVAVAAKIAATKAPEAAVRAALLRAYDDATRLPMADSQKLLAWALSPRGMPVTLATLLRDDYSEVTIEWCRNEMDALDVKSFSALRQAVDSVVSGSSPKSGGSPAEPVTPS